MTDTPSHERVPAEAEREAVYSHAQLSCGHATDERPPINERTGWYSAVYCDKCGRRRSIICLSYGGILAARNSEGEAE